MSETVLPVMASDRLGELVGLIKGADSVELKLTVPDVDRRSAVQALGVDVLDAQIRQVYFFDTADLALDRGGLVVRARRIQNKQGDSVVKLRPVVPADLPAKLRMSPGFGVEVDAMPGGFTCSASMKGLADNEEVREVAGRTRPIRKVFSKAQRAFFDGYAPDGVSMDDLLVLGPINVFKLKFTPAGWSRRLVAELWNYPDGSRILELSTKCDPASAFDVAVESRVLLSDLGIDLSGAQQTKTRTALVYFAGELAAAKAEES